MLDQIKSMDTRNPSSRQKRSVLPVFGENLRMLTAARGTQSKVSSELDIGRVQFHRYLRGESYPKPNVLKRICDYFGVDARILIEPLTDDLLSEMMLSQAPNGPSPLRGAWAAALDYAAQDIDFFEPTSSLEEGLYVAWQWCGVRKDTIIRRRIKVYRENGATVFRGYSPREFFPPGTPLPKREYRGICLNQKSAGHVMISFYAKPFSMIGMTYVTPMPLSMNTSVFAGFSVMCRDELPGISRLSRVLLERIDGDQRALLEEARRPTFPRLQDMPREYADFLREPVG